MTRVENEAQGEGLEQSRSISLKCPEAPSITLPPAAQSVRPHRALTSTPSTAHCLN